MRTPRYKPSFTKPPRNGWRCTVDGYEFVRPTRETLVLAVNSYLSSQGMEEDGERLVELEFCKNNPSQCIWK